MQVKEGGFYSIIKGDIAVGVFISAGESDRCCDREADVCALYNVHACLYNNGCGLDPISLVGPKISGHNKIVSLKEFSIRHANEMEKSSLLDEMKRKGYIWNIDKNEVEKLNRK